MKFAEMKPLSLLNGVILVQDHILHKLFEVDLYLSLMEISKSLLIKIKVLGDLFWWNISLSQNEFNDV